METVTAGVCLDYMAISRRAIGTLQRRGVCEWLEREELIAEGCLALSTVRPDSEALAVIVARRAMIDAVRKNERRERGRVEVRGSGTDGAEEASDGDQWDATVYGKQKLQPANTHPDLWEAMKALPAREYQAITLIYWGGKTQADVAVEMGVSRPRVAQIIASAEKKIQNALTNCTPHTITQVRGKEATADRPIGRNGGGEGR